MLAKISNQSHKRGTNILEMSYNMNRSYAVLWISWIKRQLEQIVIWQNFLIAASQVSDLLEITYFEIFVHRVLARITFSLEMNVIFLFLYRWIAYYLCGKVVRHLVCMCACEILMHVYCCFYYLWLLLSTGEGWK